MPKSDILMVQMPPLKTIDGGTNSTIRDMRPSLYCYSTISPDPFLVLLVRSFTCFPLNSIVISGFGEGKHNISEYSDLGTRIWLSP